jgi:polyphosphate kinase 2 (PPK2 family)
MLVNEGALVLKFWFHLSKDGQKTRLKALEKEPAHRVAGDQGQLRAA